MQISGANRRVSLRNILFTTDFSPASEDAFAYALAYARWYDSKLFVMHVVPSEAHQAIPMDPLPSEADRAWQRATEGMDCFRNNHAEESQFESILERGELRDIIPAMISKHEIDLLVLGTHGRRGIKKLILGSAAEQIFRLAACPVLTIGPGAMFRPARPEVLKRILFATNFSSASLQALPYALSLAEENEASVVLFHAMTQFPFEPERGIVEADIKARLRAMIPHDVDVWCNAEFLFAYPLTPEEGILQLANERGVDLIVMGVHGASLPREQAHSLWTVAYEVVCNAHCPVLTVRG